MQTMLFDSLPWYRCFHRMPIDISVHHQRLLIGKVLLEHDWFWLWASHCPSDVLGKGWLRNDRRLIGRCHCTVELSLLLLTPKNMKKENVMNFLEKGKCFPHQTEENCISNRRKKFDQLTSIWLCLRYQSTLNPVAYSNRHDPSNTSPALHLTFR